MALKLIRRGPETMRLTVAPGDGRVNVVGPNGLYILQGWKSWVHVTVTALNVTGISVQDRENGYAREERTNSGSVMSYSGVFYADNFGPTVAVFDPTDKTEVIMHVVRAAYQRFGRGRVGIATRRVHACDADVYPGVGAVHHVDVHAPYRRNHQRDSDPAGLHRAGVRNRHLPHDVAQGVGA